jgi:hypothetical protein
MMFTYFIFLAEISNDSLQQNQMTTCIYATKESNDKSLKRRQKRSRVAASKPRITVQRIVALEMLGERN